MKENDLDIKIERLMREKERATVCFKLGGDYIDGHFSQDDLKIKIRKIDKRIEKLKKQKRERREVKV